MKRTLIGMTFSLVGSIIDGAIIAAVSYLLKTSSIPTGPRFWFLLFGRPGVDGSVIGLSLGVPFLLSTALLVFGLVILFIELFGKKES